MAEESEASGGQLNASEYLLDRRWRAAAGGRVAFESQGKPIGYAELAGRVAATAAALVRLGVQPEQRVPLALLDGPEFAAAFLAALRIGAVPVPMSTMLTGPELAFQCADARARVAVASAELGAAVAGMAEGAGELTDLVLAGDGEVQAPARLRVHRFGELLGEARAALQPAHATWADSPAFWLYTSGTTGRPKAAMHRHGSIRVVCETYAAQVLGIRPGDRCLSAAKAFFAYGLGNSLLFPLSVGAASVLLPQASRPDLIAETAVKH